MDALKLKALQKYADNLAKVITRLSTFFEGTDASIDEELKALRAHLSGKPDFTLAAVSIQKLNPLLMDSNKQVRHRIKDKVSTLQTKIKKIQQLENAPDSLRTSIAHLLSALSLPTSSVEGLLDHLFSAVNLLEEGLAINSDRESPKASPVLVKSSDTLRQRIVSELQQWVNVYARKNPSDQELAQLKSQLEDGLNEKQLLESYLVLIRVIISETMLDATANGKAIQSIYTAISDTDKKVSMSISLSQKIGERGDAQFEQIKDILDEFDTNIDQQGNVDALKEKAHHYIGQIQTELHDQKKLDTKEQTQLMSLLVEMQSQLTSLQQQTKNYKKRLVEQKTSLYTDPLTSVPNRLAYNERAVKAMHYARSQNEPLALAIIDIDHFKSINDKYGHAAGDRTLQAIAKNLSKNLRPNEFLARWGGEEFALLMQNQSHSDLQNRLDEMRESLSKLPFKFREAPVKITASFGASCYQNGEPLQQFFERADNALYKAKEQGRNRAIINT